jgi:hypothetical protein
LILVIGLHPHCCGRNNVGTYKPLLLVRPGFSQAHIVSRLWP